MTCKLFGCDNEVQGNYPCCSMEHGISFRMQKRQAINALSANENMKYSGLDDSRVGVRNLYTVEMVEYYLNL